MSKIKKALALLLSMIIACGLFVGCQTPGEASFTFTGDPVGAKMSFDNGQADGDRLNYNSDLFYFNELRSVNADPHAIYISVDDITESYNYFAQNYQYLDENGSFQWQNGWSKERFEEENGTLEDWIDMYGSHYYMTYTSDVTLNETQRAEFEAEYGSDKYVTHGKYLVYESADMCNWKQVGRVAGGAIASNYNEEWWYSHNWAPEFFRDPETGLYFVIYSNVSKAGGVNTTYVDPEQINGSSTNNHNVSCAMSTNPIGPFYQITTEDYYNYRAAKDADGNVITGENLIDGPDLNKDGAPDYKYREIYARNGVGERVIGYKDDNGKYYTPYGYELTLQTPAFNTGYYYPRFCTDQAKVEEFERELHITRYDGLANSPIDNCVFSAIDVHMFEDPVSGKLYMFFSRTNSNHNNRRQFLGSVWGIEMIDMVTPNWDTLTPLTYPGISTIYHNGSAFGQKGPAGENEGGVNEGPEVVYHNGKYYLTYSPWGYQSEKYAIQIATADSPLGEYMKAGTDYTPVIGMGTEYNNYMAGTGHHCFIWVEDELFTLYHAQYNAENNFNNNGDYMGRVLACDRITFKYIEELGFDMMFSNGPSYNLQPKPEAYTGYTNVAKSATITANGDDGEISYLTDDLITAHPTSRVFEYGKTDGKLIITLKWDKPVTVKALMVYNSGSYDYAFKAIDCVQFKLAEKPAWYSLNEYNGYVYIENVLTDKEDFFDSNAVMRKGSSAIAEFNEIKVTEMNICISATPENTALEEYGSIKVSELYIFGKNA